MKRIIIFSSLFAGFLLLVSMGFNSCSHDRIIDDEACVVTSLSNVQTRGGALFEGDAKIEKLRVLVFIQNGGLEKSVLYQEGDEGFGNPLQICGLVKGVKDVYIVANETADLNLGAIYYKSELLAKLANVITTPIDGSQPILMTGKATGQDLNSTTSVIMPLTRITAKISLQFNKGFEWDNVIITKVSLLNNTGKTPLWKGEATVTNQTYWDFTRKLGTPLELLTTLSPISEIGDIYVYENLAGIADKDHALQLEVEALFNNIVSTYTVYINENITEPGGGASDEPSSSETTHGDHLYTIKRGYHYKLNGTIITLGKYSTLELYTEVLPWNLLQSSFDYEKVNAVFNVSPKPSPGIPMEITSLTSYKDLNFKITSPVNGVWSASLTNTTDFTLIKNDTENVYTWGVITGSSEQSPIIRIAIRPGATPAPGASTEVIVHVNGYEIDFDKSSATGPGNRLVIMYQP